MRYEVLDTRYTHEKKKEFWVERVSSKSLAKLSVSCDKISLAAQTIRTVYACSCAIEAKRYNTDLPEAVFSCF